VRLSIALATRGQVCLGARVACRTRQDRRSCLTRPWVPCGLVVQRLFQIQGKMTSFAVRTLRTLISGARGIVVVKALCYKPEGRGFEIR
jgi:hypothetical protein